MRIYDLNNDIRRLSLSMNNQNDVSEKDIMKRIHFKFSLMNKYRRYLTKSTNSLIRDMKDYIDPEDFLKEHKKDPKYDDVSIYDVLNGKVELGYTDADLKAKKKALEEKLKNLSEEEKKKYLEQSRTDIIAKWNKGLKM